jgi:Homeodomain
MEFNKNPTPTAVVRERIAQDINMTERSVQIWFQNRYRYQDQTTIGWD